MSPFYFLFFLINFGLSASLLNIVFVHLGQTLPQHLYHTVAQARLFNENASIYLIANEAAIQNKSAEISAICIPCESLLSSPAHSHLRQQSTLSRTSMNGFWFYTTERFFYLEELMQDQNLSNVFHLENDTLLYTNLEKLLPCFQKNYQNMIAATFEQDARCVPGFLYIPHAEPLTRLVQYIARRANLGETDMTTIGLFKQNHHKVWIDCLPIVPSEYVRDHTPLQSITNITSQRSPDYCNHFDEFQSVFDAASLGVFVGGDDSQYHPTTNKPGMINPNCVFNPSYCTIEWEMDDQSRRIPILIYNEKRYKINNLHLTNKEVLPTFTSQ